MFGNRMKTEAIPERVYALCREVSSRPMEEGTLRKMLEPDNLGGKTSYYGMVRTAAEELGLISIKENVISLAVSKDAVKSMEQMRRYINLHMESLSDSLFYKVTRAYFDMGTEVLEHNSVSRMSDLMGRNIGETVIEDDMRAWRFWMPFLGFGYMHEPVPSSAGIMLPNAAVFLKDLIEGLGIEKNREYTIDEFVSLITPYANIVLHGAAENKTFNYAFSNAIRMLHGLNAINAEPKSDAQEIWKVYPMESHSSIKTTVTHITVTGGRHEF